MADSNAVPWGAITGTLITLVSGGVLTGIGYLFKSFIDMAKGRVEDSKNTATEAANRESAALKRELDRVRVAEEAKALVAAAADRYKHLAKASVRSHRETIRAVEARERGAPISIPPPEDDEEATGSFYITDAESRRWREEYERGQSLNPEAEQAALERQRQANDPHLLRFLRDDGSGGEDTPTGKKPR